jgi:hypothetical protein
MATIEFLTRDGCANTDAMLANFQVALGRDNGEPSAARPFTVVDIGALPDNDPRTGYATPTVLVDGRDLLGLPAPKPPYANPM